MQRERPLWESTRVAIFCTLRGLGDDDRVNSTVGAQSHLQHSVATRVRGFKQLRFTEEQKPIHR